MTAELVIVAFVLGLVIGALLMHGLDLFAGRPPRQVEAGDRGRR